MVPNMMRRWLEAETQIECVAAMDKQLWLRIRPSLAAIESWVGKALESVTAMVS